MHRSSSAAATDKVAQTISLQTWHRQQT